MRKEGFPQRVNAGAIEENGHVGSAQRPEQKSWEPLSARARKLHNLYTIGFPLWYGSMTSMCLLSSPFVNGRFYCGISLPTPPLYIRGKRQF